MIRWFGWSIVILILVLAGCSNFANDPLTQGGRGSSSEIQDSTDNLEAQQTVQIVLQDYGMAPELSNDVWINSERPLRLADLRGKVVLIEMWTYG